MERSLSCFFRRSFAADVALICFAVAALIAADFSLPLSDFVA